MTDATLTLQDVSVARGGKQVVDRVCAALPGGAVTAICGPNGAGKSTLIGAIAGVAVHHGAIRWDGRNLDRTDVAFMPQCVAIRSTLTVLEVVLLGRLDRLGWTLREADLAAAGDALAALGLTHLAERRINTLSGGQQQLVLLAQRLMRKPRILLLDEPTSALDLNRQLLVFDMLASYARENQALVLVALHDLSLAARYASMLLLLRQGTLMGSGHPAEVLRAETIRAVYDVEAEVLHSSGGHPVIAPLHASTECPLRFGGERPPVYHAEM
ncbi:ABC transporter ATP-binding protein [Azospirillum canadense]|uniref:ABC transporter ATP-binding protein n=1 Tax=Azospirillum canadense TaxID=403962 RepID=UPI0022268B7E|nr:ABC transporter ATP-binding protein [Azospirillum canadense]MCW2241486.1 iron complex transport system ATP-binding protein [Azospirillum canadense]